MGNFTRIRIRDQAQEEGIYYEPIWHRSCIFIGREGKGLLSIHILGMNSFVWPKRQGDGQGAFKCFCFWQTHSNFTIVAFLLLNNHLVLDIIFFLLQIREKWGSWDCITCSKSHNWWVVGPASGLRIMLTMNLCTSMLSWYIRINALNLAEEKNMTSEISRPKGWPM